MRNYSITASESGIYTHPSVVSICNRLQSSEKIHEDDIPIIQGWINELEIKNWHQDIVQEMKDTISIKCNFLNSEVL